MAVQTAAPSLTDTSPAGMLHAIQLGLRKAWASFGAGPGCELLETPAITRLFTGLPAALYNIVPFFRAGPDEADGIIQQTLGYYRTKGVPAAWWLGPWTEPLFLGGGAAGLYGVATLPGARRQGIATAVVLHALREAKRAGYRIATLQATEMGEPVHRKLGFRTYAHIRLYEWHLPYNK